MDIKGTDTIPVTCDCGSEFEIPVAGLETEFTCPTCGHVDRLSQDEIRGVRAYIDNITSGAALEEVGKAIDKTLRDAVRGSKHIKYRANRRKN